MKQYLELLQDVLENGARKEDRTGTGTLEVFGRQMRFDLTQGFPTVTTKKLFFKGVVGELLWMLSGSTNIHDLPAFMQHWWSPWADEDGNLGPTYGQQFRGWPVTTPEGVNTTVDQVAQVIQGIKSDPNSRRHNIVLWNVGQIDEMRLPPCHGNLIQFNVTGGALNCQMYQRSGDMFIGVPVNIAFYSLFTHMVAQVCGLEAGEFIHTLGSAHIYLNHIEQVKTQLGREPYELPSLRLNPEISCIDDFTADDIELEGYKHHPSIKAPVAI